MEEKSPVFVKIDEYKKILDVVDTLKKQIDDVRGTINEINQLRDKEAESLKSWEENISKIEKKMSTIDKTLFEPEL